MSSKKKKEVVSLYEKQVERLPGPAQNSASGVLYAIVVATGIQCKNDNKALITNALLKPAMSCEYNGDKKLEVNGPNKTFSGLVRAVTAPPEQPKPVVKVDKSDAFSVPYIQAVVAGTKSLSKTPESEIDIQVSLEGFNKFHKYALLQSAIQRMLQINANSKEGPLDKFPLAPTLSATERSLLETELLTFTDLSATDTFKYNTLQHLDDLVTKYVSPPPNFSTTFYASHGGSKASTTSLIDENSLLKRKIIRFISPILLPQLISQHLVKEPIILGKYYEMTDQLLYALVWRPVNRRIKMSTWSPKEGYIEVAEGDRSVDRIKQKSGHAAVVITPAGQSLVHAHYSYSSREGWLSIYVDGGIVGYRAVRQMVTAQPALPAAKEEEPGSAEDVTPADDAVPVEESAAPAEEVAAPAEGEEVAPAPVTTKTKAKAKAAPDPYPKATPTFFFHTEEGCRVMVTHTPAATHCTKPDKQGTVCLTTCPSSGLQVTVSSNGTVCINVHRFSAYTSRERRTQEGAEVRRFVVTGGALVRQLQGGVFIRDVLLPSGTRILYRNHSFSKELKGFPKRLFKAGPDEWSHVVLGSDGSVSFYASGDANVGTAASAELDSSVMCTVCVDAETRALVSSFLDGRFLITHTDGLTELLLMDDTRLVTHPSGSYVILSKPLLPTIEVDVEIDNMCESHSRGRQISLSKGGLVVRKRVAMPDGASCFVKYDTRITSKVNGSIRYVKRDRASIIATDDGKVTYNPRASWTPRAQAEFVKDCADPSPPIESLSKKSASQISFAAEASQSLAEGSASHMHTSASSLLEPSHMSSMTNTSAGSNPNPNPKRTGIKGEGKKVVVKDDSRATAPGYKNTSISDVPSSPENAGTKFVIDLSSSTCRIEDYEYNCFNIDLCDPLKSTVALAGEVEGLRPTAVADVPIDPKLFVVSRGLDAVEYVSNGEFKNIELLGLNCPDISKFTSSAEGQPSDLNSTATQHNYFSKLPSGLSEDDCYTFQDTFCERHWQNRPVPPTASLQQVRLRNEAAPKKGKAEASAPESVTGKVYEVLTVLETMPLSSQGYATLTQGFERYDDFLAYRQRSMATFAVADDRGFEEKEAENLLSIRIQKSYQKAKKDAKKNKKIESSHIETSLMLEAIDSADEFDDEEGLPPLEGPMEIELQESFDSFAVSAPDPYEPAVRIATIAFDDLRTALIQVLNANVTNSAIVSTLHRTNKEYVNMHYEDPSITTFPSLSYAEFKSLYYHIVSDGGSSVPAMAQPKMLAATISSDSNSYVSDSSVHVMRMNKTAPHKLQLNDVMSSTASAASGSGINAVRKYNK